MLWHNQITGANITGNMAPQKYTRGLPVYQTWQAFTEYVLMLTKPHWVNLYRVRLHIAATVSFTSAKYTVWENFGMVPSTLVLCQTCLTGNGVDHQSCRTIISGCVSSWSNCGNFSCSNRCWWCTRAQGSLSTFHQKEFSS